jgi:hypothetical protein
VSDTRSRSRLPWIIAAVVVLLVVWGALAAVQIASMASDIDAGVAHVDDAEAGTRDLMSLVGAVRGDDEADGAADAAAELDSAVADLESARRTADGIVLAPVKLLPVLGRQLRATTTMLDTSIEVASATTTAITDLRDVATAPAASPADRVSAVRESEEVLAGLQAAIADPDLGPSEGLVQPVADARNRLSDQLAQTRTTVDDAMVGLTGVADFLEGPTTYLVLAANNAEMRAGSGMFLQIGSVTVVDGAFTLSEFTPAEELYLEQPGATLDPDIEARWGALQPNQEWRNLNLSPRFDESARMATEMWAAAGRGEVDGVMSIDVVAVQRLLELTGPVEVPTADGPLTISADDVRRQLLRKQYEAFDDRADRRDQLGAVAQSVFDAFNQRPVPAADLVGLIDRAGSERNLMLWSSDPEQQAAWEALGVAGELTPDTLMAALLNRGGTKLDPYITMDAALSAEDLGDRWRVTVQVDMANGAPEFLPTYVEGPVEGSGGAAGEYIGILSLTVPEAATEPTTSGDGFAVVGDDGPTRVIGTNVAIPRGEQRSVTVTFELPEDWDTVRVTSSARVPAIRWTAGDKEWTERRPRSVALESLG